MKKSVSLLFLFLGCAVSIVLMSGICDTYRWRVFNQSWNFIPLGIEDGLCTAENPCQRLAIHNEYWAGRADMDPARRIALELACQVKQDVDDPCGQLMRHREAKGGSDPLREGYLTGLCFAGDILGQRMPQEFKLHGKISKPLAKVGDQLGEVPEQLNDAMGKLKDAYKQLVGPQKQIKDALSQLAEAKEKLVVIQADMKKNQQIPENIATPALRGMQTTLDTLPKVERVLQQMHDALHKRLPLVQADEKSIDDVIAKQVLSLQNASDEVLKLLQQKNQFGHTLAQMLYVVSSDLAARNL